MYTKVSSIPKPKDPSSKFGKNIKIDNITIDGNQGDVNWEDFIKINNGPGGGGDDEIPRNNQKGKRKIVGDDEDPNSEDL